MPSSRTFYRQVVTVEILSETPIPDSLELEDIADEITNGAWSGNVEVTVNEQIDGPRMAELLAAQGSDPAFLQLTDDGDDLPY